MIQNISQYLTVIFVAIILAGASFASSECYADSFHKRLISCEPLKSAIQTWLEDEGVSKDFYYLAVCESGCKTDSVSKKGAIGIFQLMPWTAKHFRCDNPRDIECNTRAAARYLKHLYEYSPDFNTIIMMFNMGGHNLIKKGTTKESRDLAYCVKHMIIADREITED